MSSCMALLPFDNDDEAVEDAYAGAVGKKDNFNYLCRHRIAMDTPVARIATQPEDIWCIQSDAGDELEFTSPRGGILSPWSMPWKQPISRENSGEASIDAYDAALNESACPPPHQRLFFELDLNSSLYIEVSQKAASK